MLHVLTPSFPTRRSSDLFVPGLERLLETQARWVPHGHPPVSAWTVLEDTGLDIERARKDRRLSGIVAMLNRHAEYMQTTETRATPTSFVNGKQIGRAHV